LAEKGLQERSTVEQNRNTSSQSETHPDTTPKVTPPDAAQSSAFSAHEPDEAAREERAISVQQLPPSLPSDLAAVNATWAALPEAVKAGIVAMVRAGKAGA
jgi:hypothetical protein